MSNSLPNKLRMHVCYISIAEALGQPFHLSCLNFIFKKYYNVINLIKEWMICEQWDSFFIIKKAVFPGE